MVKRIVAGMKEPRLRADITNSGFIESMFLLGRFIGILATQHLASTGFPLTEREVRCSFKNDTISNERKGIAMTDDGTKNNKPSESTPSQDKGNSKPKGDGGSGAKQRPKFIKSDRSKKETLSEDTKK